VIERFIPNSLEVHTVAVSLMCLWCTTDNQVITPFVFL